MGACCDVRDTTDRNLDLPAPDVSGVTNAYTKFEKSLPFCQTYVDTFEKRVREAAASYAASTPEEEREEVLTTLEDLRKVFTTPAWAELQSNDSRLTKIITHDVFSGPDGTINVNKLLTFGVLNCAGDPRYKAKVLYGILQYGGADA